VRTPALGIMMSEDYLSSNLSRKKSEIMMSEDKNSAALLEKSLIKQLEKSALRNRDISNQFMMLIGIFPFLVTFY
jgi:hypothetical protein